ncbi:MAG: SRPBCC domain-containing protein [Acidimicrobiales bacterium]
MSSTPQRTSTPVKEAITTRGIGTSKETFALESPARIVQSWRSANFSEERPDSMIDVPFEPEADGTRVRVRYSNVPEDQIEYERADGRRATSTR